MPQPVPAGNASIPSPEVLRFRKDLRVAEARYFAVHAVRRARELAFTARHFDCQALQAEAREWSKEFV